MHLLRAFIADAALDLLDSINVGNAAADDGAAGSGSATSWTDFTRWRKELEECEGMPPGLRFFVERGHGRSEVEAMLVAQDGISRPAGIAHLLGLQVVEDHDEEARESRMEELEVIQAIYGEDIVKDEAGFELAFTLPEAFELVPALCGNPEPLVLEIWGTITGYPKSTPAIAVRGGGLSCEALLSITRAILKSVGSSEASGEPVVFEIVESLKENFELYWLQVEKDEKEAREKERAEWLKSMKEAQQAEELQKPKSERERREDAKARLSAVAGGKHKF